MVRPYLRKKYGNPYGKSKKKISKYNLTIDIYYYYINRDLGPRRNNAFI